MKKTVAAHYGCIKDHYAVLKHTAGEQAPDPRWMAGQATAERAGNRARLVRTRTPSPTASNVTTPPF